MEKHIILLHGALGSKDQLAQLEDELTGFERVHRFNFSGHGGAHIPESLGMMDFVHQLEIFIKNQVPENAHLTIFGYSMGGYAALLLASENSMKIDRIITLGTKLDWSPEIAFNEVKMLEPSVIENKLPAFAEELKQRHAPQDWKLLLKRTSEMMVDLGFKNYLNKIALERISVSCKLMIGDKDKMVTKEETTNAANRIRDCELLILQDTSHPIEKASIEKLIFELNN